MLFHFAISTASCLGAENAKDETGETAAEWSFSLPRIAPCEPNEAQEKFQVSSEVRLELVASEPQVVDPVAMAFDESGKLYVVEMRDYSEQADDHLGRVRRLVDSDGDGVFDTSTIFVEGLSWPTAVCCFRGGIYVAAAPNVLYLPDRNGDGLADEREVIFTGLGRGNVQGLINSFQWGLDNRIYAAVSSAGAKLRHVATSHAGTLNLQRRDFSFDPVKHIARPETGGGQHGMSFDRWGNRFVCSNSDHLQAIVFDDYYLQKNPFQSVPGARRSIAADGPQAEVFRTSPIEPWRIVRTKMRVSGFAPGLIEGGGRASGYFTSATGVTIDEGGLSRENVALIADVGSNLIHRKRLVPDGVTYRGERIDRNSELIAASDNWFRPVQMCVGPEGAVYIADMYREVIEHPKSLPPQIKKQLDLTSGRDRGRIYRIVPVDYEYQIPKSLDGAAVTELAEELENPNLWRRLTSARLLYERQDKSIVPRLRSRLALSTNPVAKLSLLYTLASLDSLENEQLLLALRDAHPQVRRHGLRLAESRFDTTPEVFASSIRLVDDPSPIVRFQLALSLGASDDSKVAHCLADILRHSVDPDIISAALLSAHSNAAELLAAILKDDAWRVGDIGEVVVIDLVGQIRRQRLPADLATLAQLLRTTAPPDLSSAAIQVLIALGPLTQDAFSATDMNSMGTVGKAQRESLAAHLSVSQAALADDNASPAERRTAIRLIALGDLHSNRSALVEQLTDVRPGSFSEEVIAALGQRRSPLVATVLLSDWERMPQGVRESAASLLCSREVWASSLLDACESQRVQFSELPATCTALLCSSRDATVRQRSQHLRGANVPADRQAAFHEYSDVLEKSGDRQRGKQLFLESCAMCHQVQAQGYAIGPSLTAMANRGAETMLYNILVPNAEIDPRYACYSILTTDGRAFSGLVAAESASSVTLKGPLGKVRTVLRVDIEEMQNTKTSLMPEGLEKTIDKSAMADLLAFIQESAIIEKGPQP